MYVFSPYCYQWTKDENLPKVKNPSNSDLALGLSLGPKLGSNLKFKTHWIELWRQSNLHPYKINVIILR